MAAAQPPPTTPRPVVKPIPKKRSPLIAVTVIVVKQSRTAAIKRVCFTFIITSLNNKQLNLLNYRLKVKANLLTVFKTEQPFALLLTNSDQ